METELYKLICQWNFDFDPENEIDLIWAQKEIEIFLLYQEDLKLLIKLVRPYIHQCIVDYIKINRLKEEEEIGKCTGNIE